MRVTIDKAGRVVIPKPIRDKAHLKPGMKLDIRVENGVVEIEPASEPIKVVRKGRLLVAVAPPGAPPMTVEDFERIREEIHLERERAILGFEPDGDLPT